MMKKDQNAATDKPPKKRIRLLQDSKWMAQALKYYLKRAYERR